MFDQCPIPRNRKLGLSLYIWVGGPKASVQQPGSTETPTHPSRNGIWNFRRRRMKTKKQDTAKLITAEDFEFVIDKESATVSHNIHNNFTSPGFYFPIRVLGLALLRHIMMEDDS